MYTNIADEELVQFHKKIYADVSYKMSEIIDNNPLFLVREHGDIVKIIPLFYCEAIESSNPEDKILGNQCVIGVYNADTTISFITNKQFQDFDTALNRITKWQKDILYGVVFDNEKITPLVDANVNIESLDGDEVVDAVTIKTNMNGEFVYFVPDDVDSIRLTISYENKTHTYEVT